MIKKRILTLSKKQLLLLSRILFFVGGIQFLIVMIFAYDLNGRIRFHSPNQLFLGLPSWTSLIVVGLSSVIVITLSIFSTFLLMASHGRFPKKLEN